MRSKLFDYLLRYVGAFGLRRGLTAFAATYLHRKQLFMVPIDGGFVWLRDDPADRAAFRHIFLERDYDTSRWKQDEWLRSRYDAILANGRIPLIIDAGANIGLASIWFNRIYPDARIVAVEPDLENLTLLSRNSDGKRVKPIFGAIWDKSASLRIANRDAPSDAFRVVEGEGELKAYTISDICAMEPSGDLFVVKIDIEGGESQLFRSNTEWMKETSLIVIEPHDWLHPGSDITATFRRRIADLPMDILVHNENIFSFMHIG